MFIRQVISYGDGWKSLQLNAPTEFAEMTSAISDLTVDRLLSTVGRKRLVSNVSSSLAAAWHFEDTWRELMEERGWTEFPRNMVSGQGAHVNRRVLGYLKQRVSFGYIRNQDLMNRWLYNATPFAVRSGHIDVPVALVLMDDAQETFLGRAHAKLFDDVRDVLTALSPLSHASPFVLLGVSTEDVATEVIDLSKEHGVELRQIVVNRSIEFPPQYHQAGLGVLSYFGSVLRKV